MNCGLKILQRKFSVLFNKCLPEPDKQAKELDCRYCIYLSYFNLLHRKESKKVAGTVLKINNNLLYKNIILIIGA